MSKRMRVLVVGGAGYIGGAVTDVLKKRKIDFTVYDALLYEHHYLKPVDFIAGDVRDTKKLKKLLVKYSHVIWLAAIVGDPACKVRPELTIAINRDAVNVLAKNYKGRIVFLSTCSVYGENTAEADETTKPNPLSLYAQTKLAAEKKLVNTNAIIFRLGTVFGVSDEFSRLRMDLAVNYMTARAVTKGELSIFGGKQWRPLIHVRNVAEAVVNALSSKKTGVYNLSTMNYQINDLGKEIARITGCKIKYADEKFQDARNYYVSTKKAKRDGVLKFDKILPVSFGVKQISDLVHTGRVKYTDADIYYNERHIANLNNDKRLL